MGLLGRGVLAIWNDVAPGGDAEFNHWHTREHIPERVSIPGFLRGRRCVAVSAGPAYFTLYETESVQTLAGPEYQARLDAPTPWTQRAIPLFRHTKRSACRVTQSLGNGVGGILGALELGPAPDRDEEFRAFLSGTALPAIADRPGIVGAHLCEADVAATQMKARTAERGLHAEADALAHWVLLLEGIDPDPVNESYADFLNPDTLWRHGAEPDTAFGLYSLAYCLSR
jgi:hypothetical protein